MIYLSAQPDEYYFLWQLELQLFNFNRWRINPNQIHVLISYDVNRGLSNYFKAFTKKNRYAQFYTYPDERKNNKYPSSVRPHIIAQHFLANKWLEKENIFYHDSDILFTNKPNFFYLVNDNIWYASDTISYTGYRYVTTKGGIELFTQMCNIVGIDIKVALANDKNMGGAQYLLKQVNTKFWKQLEQICEKMYKYLVDYNNEKGFCDEEEKDQIQAWCTDMWCLWWLALKNGKQIANTRGLDFIWANTIIDKPIEQTILHYTGKVDINNPHFFRKNNYSTYSPWYDDFSSIDQKSASYLVVDEIKKYNKINLKPRKKLPNTIIVIPFIHEQNNDIKVTTLFKTIQFLQTQLINKVLLLVITDENNKVIDIENVEVIYAKKQSSRKSINLAFKHILENTIAWIPFDKIIPIAQLVRAVHNSPSIPYTEQFEVDLLLTTIFSKSLEGKTLNQNLGKCIKKEEYEVNTLIFNKSLLLEDVIKLDDEFKFSFPSHFINKIIGNSFYLNH